MKGKLIYVAIISLFGLLSVFGNTILFSSLSLLILLYYFYSKKFSGRYLLISIVVYFSFIIIGFLTVSSQVSVLEGNETKFTLHFIDGINIDGNRFSAIAEVASGGERIILNYRLRSPQEKAALQKRIYPGVSCKVTGTLATPNQATNPNSFDYQLYLKRKEIFWILKPNDISPAICTQPQGNLITLLKRVRQKEVLKLEEKMDEELAAIFAALLFGDRNLMNPEMEEDYTKTGTVHLLAISGLHVALLTGMCFAFLLRLGMTREKAELFLILILPCYAVLTGLSPSVNRAVLMLMLMLVARRLKVQITPLDAISIAFLFLVLISPYTIYEPGFQLSFGVSLALVLSSTKIINTFQSYLLRLIAVSFVSQLASIPILLSYFYEISLISVVTNLLFVPLFSIIILPLVLVTYLTGIFFPFVSDFFLFWMSFIVAFANKVSALFASFSFSSVVIGKPNPFILLLYLVIYLLFFISWEKRKKSFAVFLLPFIPVIFQIVFPYLSPYGKVVFVDVGQGDSILIRLPYNRATYLIDTGGTISFHREAWEEKRDHFETGEDILVPFLKSEGIRKLEKLILTHGDMDHIGGAPAILSELRIEEILMPVSVERSVMERRVIRIAETNQAKVRIVGAGARWKVGQDFFQIISPLEKLEDKNEGSIVLYASFGGKRWLFTGDLGSGGEVELINHYSQMDVDVLKVGHHGSKTSSSEVFLDTIQPETAVISAGDGNRYGHPHAEVLEGLKSRQIKLYRTDTQGAVIYTFKEDSGTFRTWMP
ncbi:DNA internalization-related competence protein ComEC/Rec2 [Mesobacillus maritimus]|uniref:DNA internalization-related competence protein ComEC/Rec2 n=1 Tax=Mesobacillus maritimus TaxID=1643336 RepID=A0ABS7K232_9BACI|nr:DNA internalization-related competence protein ComEC/Rec2 [Mesobacillus maritimus]MBY0096307.1 DNA internalization-related competence protein ComEC/Rec2 [Mesobacillus maritimus]